MEKHQQKEWGFTIFILGPKLPPGVYVQQPRPKHAARKELLNMLRKNLPSDAKTAAMSIDMKPFPALMLLIKKVETTAAVVQFIRNAKMAGHRILEGQLPASALS